MPCLVWFNLSLSHSLVVVFIRSDSSCYLVLFLGQFAQDNLKLHPSIFASNQVVFPFRSETNRYVTNRDDVSTPSN